MADRERVRAREAGIVIGDGEPGDHNAITDVPGVRVGQVTLFEGEGALDVGTGPVRTGVTAVVPPGDDWYDEPLEAGSFVFNGAGTTAGLSMIDEFGRLETPVLLTNTLSVGSAYEGAVRYMVDRCFGDGAPVPWFNPVVGETSDAYLNDIGGLHVRPAHAVEAVEAATAGPVAEGAVGAGTGTCAYGFKGGIGTASRAVEIGGELSDLGVLVQSNHGGRLRIDGTPFDGPEAGDPPSGGSSIMIIVATDLPLSSRLLERVARRATFGLARTGSRGGHGSGDYVIAFSTTRRTAGTKPETRSTLAEDPASIDAAFEAVADATEEAILNSLFAAETVVGRDGNVGVGLPIDRVLETIG